jgi:hypothetical protein
MIKCHFNHIKVAGFRRLRNADSLDLDKWMYVVDQNKQKVSDKLICGE